ncbi:MAG: hypothetical protein ABI454_10635, partial [Sphingomicrobium sp.]
MKLPDDLTGLARVAEVPSWAELNRQWLVAQIAGLAHRIKTVDSRDAESADDPTTFTPALVHCANVFGLSPFERHLLLLVAGLQLDHGLRQAVAARCPDGSARASFGLALEALPQPHWDALSPDSPLRHWRMVEPEPGPVLSRAPLQIDERVLHFLAGVPANDPQLTSVGKVLEPEREVTGVGEPSLTNLVARALTAAGDRAIIVLHGDKSDAAALRDAALASIAPLGHPAAWFSANDLPADAMSVTLLARHIDREAALTGIFPIFAAEGDHAVRTATGLVARLHSPCLWLGSPGNELSALPRTARVLRFELPAPSPQRTRERLLA